MNRPPGKILLKAERKEFLGRITVYLADVLRRKVKVDRWTLTEIAAAAGVSNSVLSAAKHYDKWRIPISQNILQRMIKGGLLNVDGILNNVPTNAREKEYLEKVGTKRPNHRR